MACARARALACCVGGAAATAGGRGRVDGLSAAMARMGLAAGDGAAGLGDGVTVTQHDGKGDRCVDVRKRACVRARVVSYGLLALESEMKGRGEYER